MTSRMEKSSESLLGAIEDDDRGLVHTLLEKQPELATFRISTPKLYENLIFHWIYVGDTPLHLAAAGYRVEILEMFLAAGADSNAASNHRRGTPLHYAADGFITGPAWDAARQVKTIERLLAAGANIDFQDKNGASALHRAVRTRCAKAVECLLRLGCDVLARNAAGSTAFHLAVQNTGRGGSGTPEAKAAQREIIQAFLKAGVNTSLKDGKGKSVLDCATNAQVRELLT